MPYGQFKVQFDQLFIMNFEKLAKVILHIQFTETIQHHNYMHVYSNAKIFIINTQSTQFSKGISFIYKETFTKEVLKYDKDIQERDLFAMFLLGLYMRL